MRKPPRARDLMRALLALLVLLGLLLGLPAALLALWHPQWPPPNPAAIWHLLTSRDNGTLLLDALGLLGWAAWAGFALAVAVELPGQIRRRPTVRLPALGWAQRGAAALLTALFLAVSAPALSLAAQTGAPAATPAAAALALPATAAPTAAAPDAPAPAAAAAGAHTLYTVRSGDSLYEIAEHRLGDPEAWRAIAAANEGRVMDDGTVFHADVFLQPGWRLLLPASAGAPAANAVEHEHTVVPGDTLWAIAEHDLGAGADYPQIVAANTGHSLDERGDRLTDPNLILPGEHLTIPGAAAHAAAAAPATTAPAASTPPRATTAPSPAPTETAPTATDPVGTTATPTPTPSAAAPTPSAVASTAPARSTADPAAGHAAAAESAHHNDAVQNAALAALLTAASGASLIGVLRLRRRLQQRSRRSTERIALPAASAAAFENRVRAGHDPQAIPAVDAALRILAEHAAAEQRPLPELAAVLYHPQHGIDLRPAEPADLPAPFAPAPETPGAWHVPLAALTAHAPERPRPAPYPALIALGTDEQDATVLVDLEYPGALTLTGPSDTRAGVLRRLLLDLAGSPLADHLELLVAAADPALRDSARDHDRVSVYPDLDTALEHWEQAAHAARTHLDAAGAATIRDVRPTGAVPEAEPTHILITDLPVTADQQQRLTTLLGTTAPAPAAAILTADHEGELALPGWSIHLGPTPSLVPALALRVHIPGLDQDNQALLDELLHVAASTSSVPDPGWAVLLQGTDPPAAAADPAHVPLPFDIIPPAEPAAEQAPAEHDPYPQHDDPAETEDRADTEDPPAAAAAPSAAEQGLYIRLLGRVEVIGRTGQEQPGREVRLTEMAAYLALHPHRGHNAMAEALWPDSTRDRHPDISRLRHWLGADPSGEWYLPHRAYALRGVHTDWEEFQHHVSAGNLPAALALVRDQPFAGAAPDRYGWAVDTLQEMIGKIVDVAQALAEGHLAEREYSAARATAMVGLKIAPEREELSRIVIEALVHTGRRAEAEAYSRRVVELCDDLGVDPQPETLAVLARVKALNTQPA